MRHIIGIQPFFESVGGAISPLQKSCIKIAEVLGPLSERYETGMGSIIQLYGAVGGDIKRPEGISLQWHPALFTASDFPDFLNFGEDQKREAFEKSMAGLQRSLEDAVRRLGAEGLEADYDAPFVSSVSSRKWPIEKLYQLLELRDLEEGHKLFGLEIEARKGKGESGGWYACLSSMVLDMMRALGAAVFLGIRFRVRLERVAGESGYDRLKLWTKPDIVGGRGAAAIQNKLMKIQQLPRYIIFCQLFETWQDYHDSLNDEDIDWMRGKTIIRGRLEDAVEIYGIPGARIPEAINGYTIK